jgi:hypothetical protein
VFSPTPSLEAVYAYVFASESLSAFVSDFLLP